MLQFRSNTVGISLRSKSSTLRAKEVDERTSWPRSDGQQLVLEGIHLSEEAASDERRAEERDDSVEEDVEQEQAEPRRDSLVGLREGTLEPSREHGSKAIEYEEDEVLAVGKAEGVTGDVLVEDTGHGESSNSSNRLWVEGSTLALLLLLLLRLRLRLLLVWNGRHRLGTSLSLSQLTVGVSVAVGGIFILVIGLASLVLRL